MLPWASLGRDKDGRHEDRFANPELHMARGSGCDPQQAGQIAARQTRPGFDSLWVMDHFFQIGSRACWASVREDEMLEGYSTLGYLAGVTQQVKLGALVTGVIYRHPGLLAKTVTTLDVLSGGRAYFGIGAAWFEREARGSGRAVPAHQGALRAPGRGVADRPADVVGQQRFLQRKALSAGRDPVQPTADITATSSDPDRRHGRTQDAAPCCAVRGRLQPVCTHGDRHAWQEAGCVKASLRQVGQGLRCHREDHPGHRASGGGREQPQGGRGHVPLRWPRPAFSTASSTCRTCTRSSRCGSSATEIIPAVQGL